PPRAALDDRRSGAWHRRPRGACPDAPRDDRYPAGERVARSPVRGSPDEFEPDNWSFYPIHDPTAQVFTMTDDKNYPLDFTLAVKHNDSVLPVVMARSYIDAMEAAGLRDVVELRLANSED